MNHAKPVNDLAYLNIAEAIEKHGTQGYLINRVSRFSRWGWFLFFSTFCAFIGYVIMDKSISPPVLAVGEDGKLLGTFQYMDTTTRTDEELVKAAKYFAEAFLSDNSNTVYEDKHVALNMMSTPLREKWKARWLEENTLVETERAKSRSYVQFEDEKTGIVHRRDGEVKIDVVGKQIVDNGEKTTEAFTLSLVLRIIRRDVKYNTSGIQVMELKRY